jgi:hypothetical protein
VACHDQIEPLSVGEGHYGVYLGADHSKPLDYLASMAQGDPRIELWVPIQKKED